MVASEPILSLEYVSVASTTDGSELQRLPAFGEEPAVAFASIAVRLGTTTLIDNLIL